MSSLYQDFILDHYRNPRNYGSLKQATHQGKAHNPTCGDQLEMDIQVRNDTIEEVRFRGSGCAISQAGASLLSEVIKGKNVSEALSLEPKEVLGLIKVPLSPNRLKCALLSLETLKKTLTHK